MENEFDRNYKVSKYIDQIKKVKDMEYINLAKLANDYQYFTFFRTFDEAKYFLVTRAKNKLILLDKEINKLKNKIPKLEKLSEKINQ